MIKEKTGRDMKKEKALNLVAGMCSKKEHCSWEIQEKLSRWEIPENEIRQIMDFLHHHQFIDDKRYAHAYAEDKFRFNHWGKQKIAMMLHRKRINPEIINETLQELNAENYQESCLALLKQKMRSISGEDIYQQKAKLIRFGLGRGFDYELINQCLAKLSANMAEGEDTWES